jgi:hypothetical protein
MMQSISQALKAFVKSLEHWVHLVYALAIICSIYFVDANEAKEWKVKVAYIALFVYFGILLFVLAYFIKSYARKARYAEAMVSMHGIAHCLRDVNLFLDDSIKDPSKYNAIQFKKLIQDVLNTVVGGCNITSAVNNRACIKLLSGPQDKPFVVTWLRDSQSEQRYGSHDKYEADRHTVDANTSYRMIVRSGRRFFFCPNVLKYNDYDNSSVSNGNIKELPYRSVMVLPIRYQTKNEGASNGEIPAKIYGFLAVDSMARSAYSERFDIEMLAVACDTLFIVFDKWSRLESYIKLNKS